MKRFFRITNNPITLSFHVTQYFFQVISNTPAFLRKVRKILMFLLCTYACIAIFHYFISSRAKNNRHWGKYINIEWEFNYSQLLLQIF